MARYKRHEKSGEYTHPAARVLNGLQCLHSRMGECHPGCGHWHCPDCGLTYDEGTDFPLEEPSGPTKEDFE